MTKKTTAKAKKTETKKTPNEKPECMASTFICSNSLLAVYGVNGSEKDGKTFRICGACKIYLRNGGTRFKLLPEGSKPTGGDMSKADSLRHEEKKEELVLSIKLDAVQSARLERLATAYDTQPIEVIRMFINREWNHLKLGER